MEKPKPQLLTLKKFVEKHPNAWTLSGLRWLRFHEDTNGFKGAFLKVGGKLLIDEDAFFEAVRQQQ